jgi:hypothetical protein
MKEMSSVLTLQCAADVVYVVSNVSMILVRATLGFTDNKRRNLWYWATLMFVDRLLVYGTPCFSVAVAELCDSFYCVAEVNE